MTSSTSLRLFIALETPVEVISALRPLLLDLKKNIAGVDWEPEEKLHTTLRFIGDSPADTIPAITQGLRRIAGLAPALSYRQLLLFPGRHRPRVLSIGIEDRNGDLRKLQADIDRHICSLGFPAENRIFKPHLTIGRIRDPRPVVTL